MPAVIGWLITLLPLVWAFFSKALPKLVPSILATAGRAGLSAQFAPFLLRFIHGVLGFLSLSGLSLRVSGL